ncbi:hypothetical protein SAMN04487898_11353 [Pedobacter sp. ok626]|uniref:hypothetical protein n=1 Tax=Pedobacter sp. ok626 TaxID=1761882 RepID=UPI00088B705B|nr:hypothetical protein [Pedobacter sp. ok626]SDK93130.1 hypothetical protein SAMN04487898_11353 [Pedobacter sp. ok626]
MMKNLVFLNETDLSKSVYRVFSLERLEEIFLEQKLTLVKPKLWDDPFENFILGAQSSLPDGTPFNIGFRENYYGQCWSLTKESDAMWRIYSPKDERGETSGVKVKTTLRKLFTPMYNLGGNYQDQYGQSYNLSSFIGKVKYASTPKLLGMLNDKTRMGNKIFDQSGWGQASTFYFKRWAFRHENEIRLIFRGENNAFDIFKIDIDPFDLFDEIVLDPRMTTEKANLAKEQIRAWGYNKKIIQSGLYKIPNLSISLPIY